MINTFMLKDLQKPSYPPRRSCRHGHSVKRVLALFACLMGGRLDNVFHSHLSQHRHDYHCCQTWAGDGASLVGYDPSQVQAVKDDWNQRMTQNDPNIDRARCFFDPYFKRCDKLSRGLN